MDNKQVDLLAVAKAALRDIYEYPDRDPLDIKDVAGDALDIIDPGWEGPASEAHHG